MRRYPFQTCYTYIRIDVRASKHATLYIAQLFSASVQTFSPRCPCACIRNCANLYLAHSCTYMHIHTCIYMHIHVPCAFMHIPLFRIHAHTCTLRRLSLRRLPGASLRRLSLRRFSLSAGCPCAGCRLAQSLIICKHACVCKNANACVFFLCVVFTATTRCQPRLHIYSNRCASFPFLAQAFLVQVQCFAFLATAICIFRCRGSKKLVRLVHTVPNCTNLLSHSDNCVHVPPVLERMGICALQKYNWLESSLTTLWPQLR